MKHLGVVLLALTIGCASDLKLLREATSSFTISQRAYDHKCVEIAAAKGPPECPEEYVKIHSYEHEITAAVDALLLGPLPADTRERLKQIPVELEKERHGNR